MLDSGEVDRAIDYGQRTLALADTLGHIGLQARAHLSLGQVYGDIGDYAHAIASLEWNVANLQGELRSARFGANGIVAAISRTYLSDCHAECGTFTEGLALAEEGLRIAESVPHPFSLIAAYHGVGVVYLRQGDVQRAIPMLERGMELCQDWHILLLLPDWPPPLAWRMPWMGASPRVWRWRNTGWSNWSPLGDRGIWCR